MRIFKIGLGIIVLVVVVWFFANRLERYRLANEAFAIAEQRIANLPDKRFHFLDLSDLPHLFKLPDSIAKVDGITQLRLNGTQIEDLRLVGKLKSLSILTLRDLHVSDFSAISELPNLKILDVGGSWVFDLEPISKISSLEQLDIGTTAVKSLKPLGKMPKLNWLNLYSSYSHDGSRAYYDALRSKGVEVFNGNAYKQNYKPGSQYQTKIKFERFYARMLRMLPLSAN